MYLPFLLASTSWKKQAGFLSLASERTYGQEKLTRGNAQYFFEGLQYGLLNTRGSEIKTSAKVRSPAATVSFQTPFSPFDPFAKLEGVGGGKNPDWKD